MGNKEIFNLELHVPSRKWRLPFKNLLLLYSVNKYWMYFWKLSVKALCLVSWRFMGTEAGDQDNIEGTMMYYGTPFIQEADFPFNLYFMDMKQISGNAIFEMVALWMNNMPRGKWPNWAVRLWPWEVITFLQLVLEISRQLNICQLAFKKSSEGRVVKLPVWNSEVGPGAIKGLPGPGSVRSRARAQLWRGISFGLEMESSRKSEGVRVPGGSAQRS